MTSILYPSASEPNPKRNLFVYVNYSDLACLWDLPHGNDLDAFHQATHGKLLVIGDGDTGFGGPGNIRRSLRGYAAAGFAGISIEDQVYPKRCGSTQLDTTSLVMAGRGVGGLQEPAEF